MNMIEPNMNKNKIITTDNLRPLHFNVGYKMFTYSPKRLTYILPTDTTL